MNVKAYFLGKYLKISTAGIPSTADLDQTPHNAQGLHCLLTEISITNRTKIKLEMCL